MFGKALIAVSLAATALAQGVTVNSPASLIQCQPALLSWNGGKSPYFLAAIPGNQPSAAAIKDFGQQTGNQLTWTVDLPAGTSVTIKVTDSNGDVNYNSAVTIQDGSDSCLNGASSSAGGAAGAVTSGASASAAAPVSSASGAAASGASSAAGAVSSATAAASSAASSAAGQASSARSAAASGASSVSSAGRSAVSSATSAGAAAASSTGAAAPAAIVNLRTGLLGAVLGAAGLLL